MKPKTRFQYGKELSEKHGIDYAINFFEEREKVKEKIKHTSFEATCDWSGDKTVLEYLIKYKSELAKEGDIIKWSFDKEHGTFLAGKTFTAKVAMVSFTDNVYGVYAEYGQDLIPFSDATIYTGGQAGN